MTVVYQQAQRVLVWIGAPYHSSATSPADIIRGFAELQMAGKDHQQLSNHLSNPHNRTVVHYSDSGYTLLTHVDKTGGYWPILVDFFDKEWWRRVWVRQEIALSREALVFTAIKASTGQM